MEFLKGFLVFTLLSRFSGGNDILDMAVSELNENKKDQIFDLLNFLLLKEKLKNKDMLILLDKVVRSCLGKVVNK